MLLSCAVRLKNQGKEYRTLKLFGQERNLITSSIARMNLFLHGFEDFRIERGDTLADPKLIQATVCASLILYWPTRLTPSNKWNRKGWEATPSGGIFWAFLHRTGRLCILPTHP
jgi:type I restriction enzyme M protein